MGVLYTILLPTEEVADWLSESGVSLGVGLLARGPLLSEIREVLDSLEGYAVEYNDGGTGSPWQAMITSAVDPESGRWTLLNITSRGEPLAPQEVWFEKGHPELIVEIVCRLAARCGTFVIVPDTGCLPLVVSPGDDPSELFGRWEHLTEDDG